MANYNIQIDLTKIPGAREMDVTRGDVTKRCVVIPIDNHVGTVIDGYMAKGPDGLMTERFLSDVKLHVVAIEHRTKRNGISHGLKPAFTQEYSKTLTEDEMYALPWMGTMRPWGRNDDATKQEDDDLPEDDTEKGW